MQNLESGEKILDHTDPGIFEEFKLNEGDMFRTLKEGQESEGNELLIDVFKRIMKVFSNVTSRQLDDFLPGGKFGSDEVRATLNHCQLTNLVGENEFGDLDFSQFRR